MAVPRLARHEIVLDDGHRVGVAVCGRGLPLVLVHGFTAEGILYAQTLSRLVRMGFKVVAIDVAGHGATQGLPTGGDDLDVLHPSCSARVLDELGIRRAVFAGHSMGGRLVTQLAAAEPERAIAVVLIDAVVGDCWDRLITPLPLRPAGAGRRRRPCWWPTRCPRCRCCGNPSQAAKLGRLVVPTLLGHPRRPWRHARPGHLDHALRAAAGEMLEALAEARIPVVVIHGDRDLPVPLRRPRSTPPGGRPARSSRSRAAPTRGC